MSFRASNNTFPLSCLPASPSPASFTEAWFQKVTFGDTVGTTYPSIASETNLVSWEWSSKAINTTTPHLRPDDLVPSAKHTREIAAQLSQAFNEGHRSILMRFKTDSPKTPIRDIRYGFDMFSLFTPINNYSAHFSAANELTNHILLHPLSAPSQDRFMATNILASAEGFHLRFALSRLQCLIGENQLWDEMVSAGCEMTYYRAAAANNSAVSPVLIFSTAFYQSLLHQYDSGIVNSTTLRVRERLSADINQGFDLIVGDGTHYTHFRYIKYPGLLIMNDSSGMAPLAHILPLIRWLLSGTGLAAPTAIDIADGPRQGFQSGSCGIACLSLVEQRMYPEAPVWDGDTASPAHRRRLLEDIINWHFRSLDLKYNVELDTSSVADDPFGIADFNLAPPKKIHPAYYLPFKPILRPVVKFGRTVGSEDTLLVDSPPHPTKYHYKREQSIDVVSISSDDLPPLDIKPRCALKTEALISRLGGSLPHNQRTHVQAHTAPVRPPPHDCIVISDSDSDSDSGLEDDKQPRNGTIYADLDAAKTAIYAWQELKGHKWRTAQSKKSRDGGPRKKYMLRCDHYYTHSPKHDPTIDPSDHRQGRTIKTDCHARVNLNRVPDSDQYTLTYSDFCHNHDRSIPEGGQAARPPTVAERAAVRQFTTSGNFNRQQIKTIVKERFPNTKLENRQYSNLINESRREAAAEIDRMGGDIPAVLTHLQDENARGAGYIYHTRFNSDNVLTSIWWQSSRQQQLARRYSDILLNDNAFNRIQYQYPLDIGIVIDNFGHSRNVWYAVHRFETVADHEWVLRHHLDSAQQCPEVFASDRHPSLIAAVRGVLTKAFHIYCLHHLHDNIATQLRSLLGSDWEAFLRDFWKVYRAVSPEAFDSLWDELLRVYPASREYLNAQLYPCRDRWAYCWIMSIFTAMVRTNGRCETENRENKKIGGPKQSLLGLVLGLIDRTAQQQERELIAVRDSSRRQLNHSNETLYPRPLALIRAHAGPYALQSSWSQMASGPNYNVLPLLLPPGIDWPTYSNSIQNDGSLSFEWLDGEELHVMSDFENENARISLSWLTELVVGRGLRIQSVYRISHRGAASTSSHMLVVLTDGRTLCSCSMGTNAGIPCRHFWAGFLEIPGLTFSIGMIRPRWYQDPMLDITAVPPVTKQHVVRERVATRAPEYGPTSTLSNPLEAPRATGILTRSANRTVNSYEAYGRANAALRSLLSGVNTEEQVQQLESRLHAIGDPSSAPNHPQPSALTYPTPPPISNPPIPTQRGRPRTSRLAASHEGRRKGGGGTKRRRMDPVNESEALVASATPVAAPPAEEPEPAAKRRRSMHCSLCGQSGHNRLGCYDTAVARQDADAADRRARGTRK